MVDQGLELQKLVAQVASAYFQNTHVPPQEISGVLQSIASSLGAVGRQERAADEPPPATAERGLTQAQIRKSITPDALISFEDNRPYKSLRRHLASRGLTPEQYRLKWGLPATYPMVSANYSAARSAMAKRLGLGQLRRVEEPEPTPSRAEPSAARGPRGGRRRSKAAADTAHG